MNYPYITKILNYYFPSLFQIINLNMCDNHKNNIENKVNNCSNITLTEKKRYHNNNSNIKILL